MRNFRWDHLRQIGVFLPLESFCKVQYCPSSVLSGLCLKGGKNIWLITKRTENCQQFERTCIP